MLWQGCANPWPTDIILTTTEYTNSLKQVFGTQKNQKMGANEKKWWLGGGEMGGNVGKRRKKSIRPGTKGCGGLWRVVEVCSSAK